MNQPSPIDNFLRTIVDFFLHPGRSFGGGVLAIVEILVVIFSLAIIVLIVGIIFTHVRIWEHKKMAEARDAEKKKKLAAEKKAVNPKWQKIQAAAASGNESAYRLAIIDADSILDDHLTAIGMMGAGVQDKLKMAAGLGGFKTIDMAFEAHGIRNAVAHSGPDFQISEREARRVIGLFQKVFEEQKII